jgi:hypothetical protein
MAGRFRGTVAMFQLGKQVGGGFGIAVERLAADASMLAK